MHAITLPAANFGGVGSGSLGYSKHWESEDSHAQTNSRTRQRGILLTSSWRGCGPDTVVVDGGVAGAQAPAVLNAPAGARSDTTRRGTDRAG